jgi:hypothetical protein
MSTVAPLAPELIVSDLTVSLPFYQRAGFKVAWGRPEEKFVYLKLGEACLMLEQVDDADWLPPGGKLEKPYGRGINFQILVPDVQVMYETFKDALIIRPLMDKTYKTGATTRSFRELMIADPDGYVLRFQQITDAK